MPIYMLIPEMILPTLNKSWGMFQRSEQTVPSADGGPCLHPQGFRACDPVFSTHPPDWRPTCSSADLAQRTLLWHLKPPSTHLDLEVPFQVTF